MSSVFVIKSFIALLLTCLCGMLHFAVGDKEAEVCRELREYKFKVPFLAPGAIYLADYLFPRLSAVEGKYLGSGRRIRNLVIQLYGYQRAEVFMRIHLAEKIAVSLVVLWTLSALAVLGEGFFELIFFELTLVVLSCLWIDKQLEQKVEEKKSDMLIELPTFINGLALLINAGLPFSSAVHKIVTEKAGSGPLYHELNRVLLDINTGKAVNRAYEEFALRCRVPEITRFVTVVLQNLNRGTTDMVLVLKMLAREAWDKRKEEARKKGEKASAKLVFPMVMIFVAVAIIVLAPAAMTMGR